MATSAGWVIGWVTVALVGLLALTQAFGWAGTRNVAIVQSLTPYLAMLLVPVVAVALWRHQLLLVTVAGAVGLGLALLATPPAIPRSSQAIAAGTTGLRVASLNLWFENTRIDAVDETVTEIDADVVVLIEYTPEHQNALEATSLVENYPFRIERRDFGPAGIAVWSRTPMRVAEPLDTYKDSLDFEVEGPDGSIRLVAMHMPTPVADFEAWRRDLATAAEIGRTADRPTLLIGDLNATYWHPDFRRLLDAGFVDAHAAAGSGFSTSWPANRWFPPFVRLDHALTVGGLASTDIDDFDIPGSDHRGLVVTVAPARPAAP